LISKYEEGKVTGSYFAICYCYFFFGVIKQWPCWVWFSLKENLIQSIIGCVWIYRKLLAFFVLPILTKIWINFKLTLKIILGYKLIWITTYG
jgi:hypothetical protein